MTTHDIWMLALAYIAVSILVAPITAWLQKNETSWAQREDRARFARLEQKVNLLLDKLGIEQEMQADEVQELLLQGKKINAIKVYREQNRPIGLREAKEAVEAIDAQLKAGDFR